MINCFIPFLSLPQARQTVRALGLCDRIKNIYLLATEKIPDEVEGCEMLMIDSPASTATFRTIALHADTAYTLLYTKYTAFEPGQFAFERLLAIAGDTNAGMLYADRYLLKNGNSQQAPVIDYQKGSLRDDFDFGSLLFFRSSVLKQAVRAMDADYRFAGLYDLRLRVSELAELVHVNEYLYSEVETDIRKSGEKLFDYVDPKNRAVQIELEAVCTAYLKRVGGYLAPDFEPVTFDDGGCWNVGVHHPACGKFAVQLDSDDVYSGPDTLQKIVDAFYEQNCAMVVGTYRMTDFKMNEIPPGIIDHREWTLENGRNNALRINGLGAPRAFYTPVLRRINLPNTSYGEDYALGLRISRTWRIGRIYDVLYLCRRWEDNSDAALDVVKMNGHNTYKDRIRTWELQARIALNAHSPK